MKSKVLKSLAVLITAVTVLTGCSTSMSLAFDIATGDSVKVKLDTSDGYKIKEDNGSFSIVNESDEIVLNGMWTSEELLSDYRTVLSNGNVELTEETLAGVPAETWEYEGDAGMEYNAILHISDNTLLLIASLNPDMRDILNLLEFEVN